MLGDKIKEIRKSKGFTQEELAIRMNVVRQTISKWEKGLSVPDAEALQKLADILEVDIKQLLGAEIDLEKNNNELAEQLARINEQLIIKNRRSQRIWKIVGFVLIGFIFVNLLLVVLSYAAFDTYKTSGSTVELEIEAEEIIVEP